MERIEADFGRIEAIKQNLLELSGELMKLSGSTANEELGILGSAWREESSSLLIKKGEEVIGRIADEAGEIKEIVDALEVSTRILFGAEVCNKGIGLVRRYL